MVYVGIGVRVFVDGSVCGWVGSRLHPVRVRGVWRGREGRGSKWQWEMGREPNVHEHGMEEGVRGHQW